MDPVIARAAEHLARYAADGSDPGLCVASEADPALPGLIAFGRRCTREVVSQKHAMQSAGCAHLSGHGGTNDGIIGAAAAAGEKPPTDDFRRPLLAALQYQRIWPAFQAGIQLRTAKPPSVLRMRVS